MDVILKLFSNHHFGQGYRFVIAKHKIHKFGPILLVILALVRQIHQRVGEDWLFHLAINHNRDGLQTHFVWRWGTPLVFLDRLLWLN